jgi:predicted PhzF superfamily epimerase YddE/YHI9
MPAFRYVVADVFTSTPLAGNPVAVFTDAREIRRRLATTRKRTSECQRP